ncbi:MAG TPA: hypothetical protein VLD19_18790, partial [Chitinophagaceae bacterium]|nr:hypothetical protein [Chitinophagaceae bacterium]
MDYSYTGRNIHWFGEAAIDDALHRAFVQGALLSPAANVDVSVLYRHIDKDYRSLYSNAFTENTAPVNENGLYAGLSVRPAIGWQINGYADLFRFPWLKYRVDAPGAGSEYLLQITWTPDKQLEIYARYKEEQKPLNRSDTDAVTAIVAPATKQDLRLQCNTTLSRQWSLLQRVELCRYDNNGPAAEQGFSAFTDARYQSASGAWRGSLRLHYFETTGYNARIYALESDLPYHISVPALYDKGFRYYLNAAWEGARKARRALRRSPHTTLGLRWAQTIYRDKTVIGSGPDAITGNRKTELTVQLMLNW